MTELKARVQAYLDRRSDAYFADDFSAIVDMIIFPYPIVTRSAVLIIEDEAKMREGFDAWRNMLVTQRVSHVVSTVIEAMELEDDLISARYVTHLLNGATPICPPYKSSATLRVFEDGKLRSASMTTGMNNLSWPITVPRVEGDGETLE